MTRLVLAYDRSPAGPHELHTDIKLVTKIVNATGYALHSVKVGIETMACEVRWPDGTVISAGIEMRHHISTEFSGFVQAGIDAKFHDIGHSMARAVRNLAGKWHWATVHACASESGLREMVRTVKETAGSNPTREVGLVGVTVTSDIEDAECYSIFGANCENKVIEFAHRLIKVGIKGIVCSGLELQALRNAGLTDELTTMVVGVRPEGSAKGDQKRVTTPEEVARLEADFAVVGRPIWDADDPVATAKKIAEALMPAV